MRLFLHISFFTALTVCFVCCKNNEPTPGDTLNDYVVFAWNDLGMHCLNPSYDELVILPPYNNVNVQVVKRGNPPSIVTGGITVEYRILNNTTSSNKRAYGGFWTYYTALFGGNAPPKDIGMTGTSLSGQMTLKTDHFAAEGIPVVPVDDSGNWDPLQVMEIKIRDSSGSEVAVTRATVPTSDEINCAKCHSGGTTSVFTNILKKHDNEESTNLLNSKPVLCAKCHGSPALGMNGPGPSGKYLSQVIHGYHSSKNASCYDCHPGVTTQCSRSKAHMGTSGKGNCTACHGDMALVSSTIKSGSRIPWVNEPNCGSCHKSTTGLEPGNALYRNSKGHGNLFCSACHGSPHVMFPSRDAKDNYQPNQHQGSKIKSIGSCGTCHNNSRGEGAGGEFNETHAGNNPRHRNNCNICHTSLSSATSSWPHAYSWENTN